MVKINEGSHYQLAIHTITHSSVARNRISEILNMIGFTFILTDLLRPEAKNPPKGPIVLANNEKSMKWACSLVILKEPRVRSYSIGDLHVEK